MFNIKNVNWTPFTKQLPPDGMKYDTISLRVYDDGSFQYDVGCSTDSIENEFYWFVRDVQKGEASQCFDENGVQCKSYILGWRVHPVQANSAIDVPYYSGQWYEPDKVLPENEDGVYAMLLRKTENGKDVVCTEAFYNKEHGWWWEDKLGATGYRVIAWTEFPPICDFLNFEEM